MNFGGVLLALLFVLPGSNVWAQSWNEMTLARGLADPLKRDAAVKFVSSHRNAPLQLILSWTVTPPDGVDPFELKIGLAEAFGRMRTIEAIPFLVKNISMDRTGLGNTWLKSPAAVEERLPAAAALIQIGQESVPAIFQASAQPTGLRDRLAMILVISRMPEFPGKKTFLLGALGEANLEREWAETALEQFGASKP